MAQETAGAYWRLTVLWLIAACGLGLLCAIALFSPDVLNAHATLGFGRLVAGHRAVIVHGFFFSAVYAVGYTLLPKLTQSPNRPRPWSLILALIGAFIVLIGVVSVLAGHGSGREYADFPPAVAIVFWLYLVAVALDLGFIMIGSRGIIKHPLLGLLLPAALLPAVIYPFALPDWWGTGMFAALRTWISLRALFVFSFMFAGIAIAMTLPGPRRSPLVIPRGAYSVGVGLIASLGAFLGILNLLDAPISAGLKAWGAFSAGGVTAGIALLVWILWPKRATEPQSLLVTVGLLGLGVGSIQGLLMVLPPFYSAFHYTSHTASHVHLMLGSIAAMFLAGALISAANLTGSPLQRPSHARWGAALFIGGVATIFFFQEGAGIIQATAFSKSLGYPDWAPLFRWLHMGVIVGGVAALAGAVSLAMSILSTLRVSPQVALSRSQAEAPSPEAAVKEDEG